MYCENTNLFCHFFVMNTKVKTGCETKILDY